MQVSQLEAYGCSPLESLANLLCIRPLHREVRVRAIGLEPQSAMTNYSETYSSTVARLQPQLQRHFACSLTY